MNPYSEFLGLDTLLSLRKYPVSCSLCSYSGIVDRPSDPDTRMALVKGKRLQDLYDELADLNRRRNAIEYFQLLKSCSPSRRRLFVQEGIDELEQDRMNWQVSCAECKLGHLRIDTIRLAKLLSQATTASARADLLLPDLEKRTTTFYYIPHCRCTDGDLVMPTSTYGSDYHASGAALISPESPDYLLWLAMIERAIEYGDHRVTNHDLNEYRSEFAQLRDACGGEAELRARLMASVPVCPETPSPSRGSRWWSDFTERAFEGAFECALLLISIPLELGFVLAKGTRRTRKALPRPTSSTATEDQSENA